MPVGIWTSTLKARASPPATVPGTALPRNVPPVSRSPRNRSTRDTPEPEVAAGSKAEPEITRPPSTRLSPGFGLPNENTGHAVDAGPGETVWAPAGTLATLSTAKALQTRLATPTMRRRVG